MSILENLEPTKQAKTFEITAFDEDMELFLGAIDYLSKNYKGTGKFTQEALFEHLTNQLRGDKELLEFMQNKPKRRGRGGKSKAGNEKTSGVVQ